MRLDSATPDAQHIDLAKRIAGPVGRVEDGIGVFFATLLTLMIGGLAELLSEDGWRKGSLAVRAAVVTGALAWIILDVPYLIRLWHSAFRKGRHPALKTAESQYIPPLILRPFVGLWWFAHFALGVGFVLIAHTTSQEHGRGERIFSFCFATCFSYGANGYLILAVAAITRSAAIRRRVWKCRGLVDLLLGVIGFFLA